MIQASDFRLLAVQAILYPASHSDFSATKILSTVLGRYAGRYQGDVVALPFPEDTPPEFPRLQLQSSNGEWQFSASPSRLESKWVRSSLETEPDNPVVACAEVLEVLTQEAQIRIGRMALVISRFKTEPNPAFELVNHFCNDQVREGPLRRSANFELHNHKKYQVEALHREVNSWVRCKTATLATNDMPVINIEQDLNTPEEDRILSDFSIDDIHAFFAVAPEEALAILRLYFPEEGA